RSCGLSPPGDLYTLSLHDALPISDVREIAQEEAVSLVPGYLQSYLAHPAWTESDVNWLFRMASDNHAAGALRFCAINDRTGSPRSEERRVGKERRARRSGRQ